MTSPAPASALESNSKVTSTDKRYIRQELFPSIGKSGQDRLNHSRVVLVGCGALGSTVADLLVRAGIGELTIVDRDYVEIHNLQRQSLFTEDDVTSHTPKAIAAQRVLASANSDVQILPVVADFNGSNAERLTSGRRSSWTAPTTSKLVICSTILR